MKKKRKSFLSYYNTYFEKIYRYLFFRVGRNRQLAEDLTSEVMLKALEHFEDFDHGRSFSVWIYRIARNHLFDFYRKAGKDTVPLDAVAGVLEGKERVVEQVEGKMKKEKVEQALDVLPDQQREVFILKFFQDLSHGEIASILQLKEAHVRVLQHRAVRTVRKRLSFLAL